MSTYYSLVFTYKRNELTTGPAGFYDALIAAGAEFKGGCFEDSSLPLSEIAAINSQKLIDNFELGYDEDCSNDYKQAVFALDGFSGARVFIMNNDTTEGEYYFNIILSENEVLMNEGFGIRYKKDSIDRLFHLAKSIMKSTKALLVQTEPELCSETVSYEEFKSTGIINANPFALTLKESAAADERYYTSLTDGELAVIYDKKYNLTERT